MKTILDKLNEDYAHVAQVVYNEDNGRFYVYDNAGHLFETCTSLTEARGVCSCMDDYDGPQD